MVGVRATVQTLMAALFVSVGWAFAFSRIEHRVKVHVRLSTFAALLPYFSSPCAFSFCQITVSQVFYSNVKVQIPSIHFSCIIIRYYLIVANPRLVYL